jgi:hypothetical protein
MKIFLNDRTIEFHTVCPENPMNTMLVVEYHSNVLLQEAWDEFSRYEKYRQLIIFTTDKTQDISGVFEAFASLFKVVYAAGGLVKNEKGEYLFIHRLGFWDLPKGKIDKKDVPGAEFTRKDIQSARAAAIREVKEETGLNELLVLRELSATWHIYLMKERWILKKTQWFEMEADSGQTLKPQTSEGIFLVKWTSLKAIHCILSHTYSSIRELLIEVLF